MSTKNIDKLIETIGKLSVEEVTALENALGKFKESIAKVELSTLDVGDVFKIGEHDFIVLEQDKDLGHTFVISKGFMDKNKVFGNNTRYYNKSNIKKLIERDIQPIIENEVGAENIVEHEIDLTSVDMQNEFGTCKCKVRLITFDEARKYNDLIADKDLPDLWWTCTPWSTEERGWRSSMAVVSPVGFIGNCNCDCGDGVRPVCILKSNIFVSKGE